MTEYDKIQEKRFLHRLDAKNWVELAMWKPTTMVETTSLSRMSQKRISVVEQLSRKSYVPFRGYFLGGNNRINGPRYVFVGRKDGVLRVSMVASSEPPTRLRIQLQNHYKRQTKRS